MHFSYKGNILQLFARNETMLAKKHAVFLFSSSLGGATQHSRLVALLAECRAFSTSNQAGITGYCRAKVRGQPIGDVHVSGLGHTPLSACLVLLAIRADKSPLEKRLPGHSLISNIISRLFVNLSTRLCFGICPGTVNLFAVMLCEYCLPIFQRIEKPSHPDWKPYKRQSKGEFLEKLHHPNEKSLENSVTQGCIICKQLHWKTRDYPPGELTESSWKYCLLNWRWAQDDSMHLEFRTRTRSLYTEDEHFIVVPPRFLDTKSSMGSRDSKLPVSDSLQAARQWMRLCSETHEDCKGPHHPDTFPTRLLEIGAAGVKLILTKDKKPTGPYAALSYCWGPPPYKFPRLKTSNMDERLESEIPNAVLPPAFREAISFVQDLGIHYIWIDCLCIVQDGPTSADDWKVESSQMKSVYSNCELCLSLDRATSPQESILRGPTPEFMVPFEINTTGIFDTDDSTAESTKCVVFDTEYFNNSLYRQPLGFRAWALQEKILSKRLLGFGESELFWSCRQLPHACESFPSGIASSVVQGLTFSPSFIPVTSDLTRLYETWCDLVNDYSGRTLTYPEKDKLVALSAVASLMEEATTDQCIAGHLWKSIPQSLIWTIDNSRGFDACLKLRKSLSIPSWSWASVDGRVWFHSVDFSHGDEASLARSIGYFEPPVQNKDVAMMSSVLLELSVYYITGTMERRSNGPFHIDQPAALATSISDCNVRDDDWSYDQEDIETVFCPISLKSNSYWGGAKCNIIMGVFQVETGREVGGRKVYERIAQGLIVLNQGLSWHEVVKDLGMEKSPILLG